MDGEARGWRITRLHHVAFAHGAGSDPEERLAECLGLSATHEETAPGFVERMFAVGDSYLQTLEASGEGIVQRFLERRGPALHHVAFEVDAIEVALEELREQGVRLVDERPRPGGMGTRIAFIHPSAFGGLLVELVQRPEAGGPPPGAE